MCIRDRWTTYHFGPKQDTSKLPFGPSKNLIGIGQFPVKMGVTGYTYDGEVKGVFASFGDYLKGGRLTLAFGRATNINYAYTGPMMRGVALKKSELLSVLTKKYGEAGVNAMLSPIGGIDVFNAMSGSSQVQLSLIHI